MVRFATATSLWKGLPSGQPMDAGGRVSKNRMSNEKENASDPNGYHEEPQQEDLRYPFFRSRLLIQVDAYCANNQADNQKQ
jgi:hypothetical protein